VLLNTAPTPVFLHTATPTHAPQTLCAPETNEPDVANPAPHTTPLHATHPCTLRVLQTALIVPLQARRHAGTQARKARSHAPTQSRTYKQHADARTHAQTHGRMYAGTTHARVTPQYERIPTRFQLGKNRVAGPSKRQQAPQARVRHRRRSAEGPRGALVYGGACNAPAATDDGSRSIAGDDGAWRLFTTS
jgi:hypothetical protein